MQKGALFLSALVAAAVGPSPSLIDVGVGGERQVVGATDVSAHDRLHAIDVAVVARLLVPAEERRHPVRTAAPGQSWSSQPAESSSSSAKSGRIISGAPLTTMVFAVSDWTAPPPAWNSFPWPAASLTSSGAVRTEASAAGGGERGGRESAGEAAAALSTGRAAPASFIGPIPRFGFGQGGAPRVGAAPSANRDEAETLGAVPFTSFASVPLTVPEARFGVRSTGVAAPAPPLAMLFGLAAAAILLRPRSRFRICPGTA